MALRFWSIRHAVGLKRLYDFGLRLVPPFRVIMVWFGRASLESVVRPLERIVKKTLFDCKMCGQCALSSTGMACPTNCAKNMRNGPCGGVRANGHCEVLPAMRCVWVGITEGRKRLAAAHIPLVETLSPIDHRLVGTSSWMRVIAGERPTRLFPATPPVPSAAINAERHTAALREIHSFERVCRSDRFVVTVEVGPPDAADPALLLERAHPFEGLVDAVNLTDCAGGNCHMSSVAASAVLAANGFTPVYQISCRDRNRIAVQGDILGAATLGIRNILCLTGDAVANGDHPMAKPVFDLDSVSLLRVARHMRDHGEFSSGRKLKASPNVFLGATVNPFVPPYVDRVHNLAAKIDAGAQFIQTQFCFDIERFMEFMRAVRARGLHRQCALIVGVGTLGSAKAFTRMAALVPGVDIPSSVISRVATASDQKAEGKRILIETIRLLADTEGVAGVHLMGYRNEKLLAEAIIDSGVRGCRKA